MEQTLRALVDSLYKALASPTGRQLVDILQKAPSTILLLLLLHFYFKAMLFGPLAKVLKQREALTKGARLSADESLASAERKTAEYEAKLRDARAEVYREQEEIRRTWLAEQAQQIEQAHDRSAAAVRDAKYEIAREAAAARTTLLETSGALADQIAGGILSRRRS